MNKLVSVLKGLCMYMYAILCVGILILDVCFQYVEYYRKRHFLLPNIAIVLCIGIAMFLLSRLLKKKKEKIRQMGDWIDHHMLWCTVGLLCIQLFLCLHLYFMTGWDSGIITANADLVANGKTDELWNWYYSRCPNNSLLTAVYAVIFFVIEKVGLPSVIVRLCIVAIQCVLSSWTGYLVYQCTKKIQKGKLCALLAWIVYVGLIGLSPWVLIPYSDASCLWMPIFMLYLYLTIKDGKKWIKLVAISVLAYLGYEMKPMVLIVFLAIFVVEILYFMQDKGKNWKHLLTLLLALVCTVGICKAVPLEQLMGFEIDKEATFGMSHYFMMGLNEEHSGVFIIEDADYSESIPTEKMRVQENIRVAKERIKKMGFVGLTKHGMKKALVNFDDGTFAWSQEGNFYGIPLNLKQSPLAKPLQAYYYENGALQPVFQLVMQSIWMVVVVGMALLGLIQVVDRKQEWKMADFVLAVAMLGITAFVMLFEARARYIYTFVPLFIVSAAYGYKRVFSFVQTGLYKAL